MCTRVAGGDLRVFLACTGGVLIQAGPSTKQSGPKSKGVDEPPKKKARVSMHRFLGALSFYIPTSPLSRKLSERLVEPEPKLGGLPFPTAERPPLLGIILRNRPRPSRFGPKPIDWARKNRVRMHEGRLVRSGPSRARTASGSKPVASATRANTRKATHGAPRSPIRGFGAIDRPRVDRWGPNSISKPASRLRRASESIGRPTPSQPPALRQTPAQGLAVVLRFVPSPNMASGSKRGAPPPTRGLSTAQSAACRPP